MDAETKQSQPWIGVDLDGTLAHDGAFIGKNKVGKPVKAMLKRVRAWREQGYEVRIFTARASDNSYLPAIQKWLEKHKLGNMVITNRLDRDCLEVWDDRAIQVQRNTGDPVRSLSMAARPRAPLLEEAFPHEDRPNLR